MTTRYEKRWMDLLSIRAINVPACYRSKIFILHIEEHNMLTTMQKIRLTLTGSPSGEPHFQHEGEGVTRWITGGTLPDIYVTFHQRDNVIEVRCPTCQTLL